jgi:8-oxo-dGTP diphosphatase
MTTKLIESVVVVMYDTRGWVLMLKRHPNTHHGGKWGFPGGKIDLPETPRAAAIREVKEETGFTIDLDPQTISWIDSPPYRIGVFFYALTAGHEMYVTLNPKEHTAFEWIAPYEALMSNMGDHLAGAFTEHILDMLAKGPTDLGATGMFPKGKIDPNDEGELQLAIAADLDNGVVRVDFGKPVAWLGLPPDEARTLGQMLIDKANQLTQ